MAYFSNGTEGSRLDTQCQHCKFGEGPCPIYRVQANFNYDQITEGKRNSLSRAMDMLVNPKGICEIFRIFLNEVGDEFAKKNFPKEG